MATALPTTGIVSFVLTDIEGSTALWDSRPESMVGVLDLHDELVERVMCDHGGTLLKAKGEGDSTLSVFARAFEAVRAAIALQHEFTAATWPDGLVVPVRVAVHTGEVHHRNGDYFGATLSRAARLRAMARGGEVVVSDVVEDLIRERLPDDFRLVDGGEHQLRGFTATDRVWWLASSDAIPAGAIAAQELGAPVVAARLSLPRGLDARSLSACSGRHAELARLGSAWTDVVHSRTPAVVFVSGEPGIGKTRLVSEFATTVHAQGANVLLGRCDEQASVALQPFAEALASWASAASEHELGDHVARFGSELSRLGPGLARVSEAARPLRNARDDAQSFLFDAVVGALHTATVSGPLLLVIDDLHWSDRATLTLLRHVLRVADLPLMLICTYRDTDLDRMHPLSAALADLRTEGRVTRVPLDGLNEEAVASLLDTVLAESTENNGALARAIHEQSAGNPFFVGEVLRHLGEVGAFEDGAALSSAAGLDRLGLPEGIREVIGRRLARLSDASVRALRVASLVGSSFAPSLLEAIPDAVDEGHDLIDALDEAVRARILVESGQGYAFAHALNRQTLRAELTAPKQTRLHRRIAEAIESRPGGGSVEALAFHFGQCALDGQLDKALHYAERAAAGAINRGAWQDARDLLEGAIVLLELDEPVDLARRAELRIALIRAIDSSDIEEQVAISLAAMEDARAASRLDLMARAVSVVDGVMGYRIPKLVAAGEEVLALLGPDGDPALRSMVLQSLAHVRAWHMSEGDAVAPLADEAFDLAVASGQAERIVDALRTQFVVLRGTPQLERLTDIALRLEALQPPDTLMWGESNAHFLGETALRRGDRASFDVIRARIRNSASDVVASYLLKPLDACAALIDGRLDAAFALAIEMIGGSRLDVTAQTHLLTIAGEQGRVVEFLPLLRSMHEESPTIVGLHTGLASWEAQGGDHAVAQQHLSHLVADDLAAVARDSAWPTSLSLLADAATRLDDATAAATLLRHLSPFAGQIISSPARTVHGAADRHLATLRHTLGETDLDATFGAALALERSLGGPVLPTRTEFWWGWAQRATNPGAAREHFAAALKTATDLGMVGLAAEVEAALTSLATAAPQPEPHSPVDR